MASIIKTFSLRLPKEIWTFLKKQTIEQEKSMNHIILDCLEKYKKKLEKKIIEANVIEIVQKNANG